MPRSGTGWIKDSPKGEFIQRAYCPICTRLVYEAPEILIEVMNYPGKSTELIHPPRRFREQFCNMECAQKFVDKWETQLRKICKSENAIRIGLRFLVQNGMIPAELGDHIGSTLESTKEKTPNDNRNSPPTRRNRYTLENQELGGVGLRGVSITRVILDDQAQPPDEKGA